MRCLETRRRADNLIARRYERDDGTRVTTYEVPATVLKSIGMKRVKEALAAYSRGVAARQMAADVRAAVVARDGWKATAVANDLGITEARVRQIRKTLTDEEIDKLITEHVRITDPNLQGAVYMAMRDLEAIHGIKE